MATMTTTATDHSTLTDWHKLRDWAVAELTKRQEDAAREAPLYARSCSEAQAALVAARRAYTPFLSIF